jgi:sec-independent protein translocase protein TatC
MSVQPASPFDTALHPVEAGAEMTLIEHLLELRSRAIKSAFALVLGIIVCAIFWETILGWLLAPIRIDQPDFKLVALGPIDRISIIFKIVLYGGVLVASPVLLYQALAFVVPGLTPRERKMLAPATIGATFFLLGGMAFAYWIILPASLGFLFGVGGNNFETIADGTQYISFVVRIVFWVGVAFELPVVLAILARFGIIRAKQLIGFWRYALVLIAVVSALITPTPDPLNMSLVMGPLIVLYAVGILFSWVVQKRREPEFAPA